MIDTSYIPAPNGEYKRIKKNGTTADIINSIQGMDSYYDDNFCKFSQQFGGGVEGLRKLWRFVKYEIRYQKDDFDISKQQNPPALWNTKEGDCKSKTLFINAVLRCIKIPYITRYTNYKTSENDIKHVYTVAILNGKEYPIDSVFDVCGSEKPYNKKIDYMAEIIEISGFDEKGILQLPAYTGRINNPEESCWIYPSQNLSRLVEIRQKKSYVEVEAPIEFHKISEAQASLEIAIRELKIMGIMRPELTKLASKGIELYQKAIKGNFCPTGDIPSELDNVVKKIKVAETQQRFKANGYGLPGLKRKNLQRIVDLEKNSQEDIGTIYPQRHCLNSLWMVNIPVQKQVSPFDIELSNSFGGSNDPFINGGSCKPWGGADGSLINYKDSPLPQMMIANLIHSPPPNLSSFKYGDAWTYFYGRDSKHRVGLLSFGNLFTTTIQTFLQQNPTAYNDISGWGKWSVGFQSEAQYKLLVDQLNESSGVLNSFVNDVYKADASAIDGTMGSGLIYNFNNDVKINNQSINLNRLPGTVLTKKGFQDQFIDATVGFTGVSMNSIKGLSRNGVLFDNGGTQPEQTLSSLLAIYENRYTIPGINCPPCPIIAAIVAIVAAIVGAVISASERSQKAELEAAKIDSLAKDTAQFSGLGPSLLAGQDDYLPNEYGIKNEGGANTALLIGAVGLGAYALMNKDKK